MKCEIASRGFTLIELMVTVAIIAILASFVFPMIFQYETSAKRARCIANMKQIHNAVESRRVANGTNAPETDWGAVYVGSTAYFRTTPRCPNNLDENYDLGGATDVTWMPRCKMTDEPYLHFFDNK